jgi:polar amino acid transport system substrate-binding protein
MLRVGISPNSAPLIYRQGENFTGLEAELAKEFGKFTNRSVRFIELAWLDQIPALLDNRIDIIMSGMSITKSRHYRIAFSEPYFRTGQMALVRKREKNRFPMSGYYGILAWLPSLKIGVIKGTTGQFFVEKRYDSAKKILYFSETQEAIASMKAGNIGGFNIDMLIHDAPIVFYLAAENEGELAPLPALLTEEYLAWGIRKDNLELLETANAFIASLKKDGRLDSIIKRWIPIDGL